MEVERFASASALKRTNNPPAGRSRDVPQCGGGGRCLSTLPSLGSVYHIRPLGFPSRIMTIYNWSRYKANNGRR